MSFKKFGDFLASPLGILLAFAFGFFTMELVKTFILGTPAIFW